MFFGCSPCCGATWKCPLPTSGRVEIDLEWSASISGIVTDSVKRDIYEISASIGRYYSSVLPGMNGDQSYVDALLADDYLSIGVATYQTPAQYGQPYALHFGLLYSPCFYGLLSIENFTLSQRFSYEPDGYGQEVTSQSATHGNIGWQQTEVDNDGRYGNYYSLQIGDSDDGSFSGQSTLTPVENSWTATRQLNYVDYYCSASITIYDILINSRSVFRPAFYKQELL